MSKANAIFRQVSTDLDVLSEYLKLHEDDFEPINNDFMQSLVENMQGQLKRIENTWNECREVER
jgi:tRNA A-37 threonylcarbamoyl transferase component Bud32